MFSSRYPQQEAEKVLESARPWVEKVGGGNIPSLGGSPFPEGWSKSSREVVCISREVVAIQTRSALILCKMDANVAKPGPGAACPGTGECVSGHLTQEEDGPKP